MSEPSLSETITGAETTSAETGSAETASTSDFRTQLSAEYKDAACLQDVPDLNTLAKNYIEAQSELGRRVRIPSEHASAEDKEAFLNKIHEQVPELMRRPDPTNAEAMESFYAAIGRPSSANEYLVPEDINLPQSSIDNIKNIAHRSGLTQTQLNEFLRAQQHNYSDMLAQSQELDNQSAELLKKEWGADYDVRVDGAKQALQYLHNKYPDQVQNLKDSGALSNAVVISLLSELGRSVKEKTTVLGEGRDYGMTGAEAEQRIKEIYGNPNHAFNNPAATLAEQKAADAEMRRLYMILDAARGQG